MLVAPRQPAADDVVVPVAEPEQVHKLDRLPGQELKWLSDAFRKP